MHAAIHLNDSPHQRLYGWAMRDGLERHGIRCELHPFDVPAPCDFAVTWGYRQPRIAAAGVPHLVMERGHLQPRETWISIGWDGLAGRGRYAQVADGGARFRRHWGELLQPWREIWDYSAAALVCGQVPGDAALAGLDINAWAQAITDVLTGAGQPVLYRPHPLNPWKHWYPDGAELSRDQPLSADLARAKLAITYNSTVAVETVLAGVPTIAVDEGSMAWDVTAHQLRDVGACLRPPREPWAHSLAWCQWSLDEIRDGAAWEHLAPLMSQSPAKVGTPARVSP